MKTLFALVGIFVAVLLLVLVLDWIGLPFSKVSTENVQKQWAFAYEYDESLKAAARQVCFTEHSLTNNDDTEKAQRQSQLLAYEQNYARIEAQYDQKLRNAFEAKYIRPSDVPRRAPTLDEMKTQVCSH